LNVVEPATVIVAAVADRVDPTSDKNIAKAQTNPRVDDILREAETLAQNPVIRASSRS
jgi:hypothetical protein